MKRAWHNDFLPHARHVGEQQAALADAARQLEARQQARVDFIDTNSEMIDRIVELGRAFEIERGADRRSRSAAARRTATTRPTSVCRSGLRTTPRAGSHAAIRAGHLKTATTPPSDTNHEHRALPIRAHMFGPRSMSFCAPREPAVCATRSGSTPRRGHHQLPTDP
jgi:hypothetical protein